MRNAFLLLVTLAFALLAAALAPVFLADPGVVQIHFHDWTLEMSVLVFVVGGALVWLIIHLLIRIWQIPARTARRVREQRGMKQLEKGLLALTEGDWTTAERELRKSTNTQGRLAGQTGGQSSTALYLAAAQAADGQDATDRAEWYLEQADSGGSRTHFLVELTRARLLVDNQHFDEALPVLEALQRQRKRHGQVLELLSRCYRALGKWESMQSILPLMQKCGLVDADRAQALKNQAAVEQLKQCRDIEHLHTAWKALPKDMQKSSEVVSSFAHRAARLGGSELTESIVRAGLKHSWDPDLVLAYGDPGASDANRRLKQCEMWIQEHPEDARLHLALGRLCAREELWGKARHHMIRSLELEPTIAGYDSFGQLLERQGDLELAMACFRNALRMSQGEKPEPLPGGQVRLSGPLVADTPD